MRCSIWCPACQNIYGDYESPCYGCVLFDELSGEVSEDKYGEEGCTHTRKYIENLLEQRDREITQ